MLQVEIVHGVSDLLLTDRIPSDGGPRSMIPAIVSLSELRIAPSAMHGGMISSEYGTVTILPSLFAHAAIEDNTWWPPPRVLRQITLAWWPEDGSAVVNLPAGTVGWLESWDSSGVTYSLHHGDDLYNTIVKNQRYTGALTTVFNSACAVWGLSLVTTWARSPSPTVDWVAQGDNRIIDNLDALARFYSHAFFIEDSLLYLVDMTAANAITTAAALTSADIKSVQYSQSQPILNFAADFNPPYVKSLRLKFLATNAGSSQVQVVRFWVAKSVGANMARASSVSATASNPSYPVANLTDSDEATYWLSGFSAVPGVTLTATNSTGQIAEYAIGAGEATLDYAPTQWELWGYNEWSSGYEYIQDVQSIGWALGDLRKFAVPDGISWPLKRDNPYETAYRIGETMVVSPSCHTVYGNIFSALASISTVMNIKRCRITLPIRGIKPRQTVTLTDTTTAAGKTITATLRVDSITYNFDAGEMTIEGGGNWA